MSIDRASLELMEGRLASDHPGEVLYALELIVEHGPERLPSLVPTLLEHPAPAVRRRALEEIARLEVAADDAVRELIAGDPDPAVRGDAVRTLIALGEDEVIEEVVPHLQGADRELTRGAMAGLLESGSIEAIVAAGEKLVALQRSAEPADRAFAARVIGEVGIGTFYRPLLKLLHDLEAEVRKAALLACRRVSNPKLWPHVIDDLAGPLSSPEAVLALRRAGEAALPGLERAFERPGLATEVRVRLARATGGISGPGAENFLWRHREHPDPETRHGVLSALASRRFRADDRRGEVAACIRRETAAVAETCSFLSGGRPAGGFLAGGRRPGGRPAEGADGVLLAAAIRYDGKRCEAPRRESTRCVCNARVSRGAWDALHDHEKEKVPGVRRDAVLARVAAGDHGHQEHHRQARPHADEVPERRGDLSGGAAPRNGPRGRQRQEIRHADERRRPAHQRHRSEHAPGGEIAWAAVAAARRFEQAQSICHQDP